jgi:DNA polymerase (family 10)
MKNRELAKLFDHTADVMAILGENTFRVLAYRKIGRVLEELPQDIEAVAKSGELENLAGIGKSSADKINEYLRTGKISEFESIWAQVPTGVMEMTKIPSLGPKTAAMLWQEAGITSPEQLKAKIEAGQLKDLPGLGEKKLQKILQGIVFMAGNKGRMRLGEALPLARQLEEFLRALPGVQRVAYCGSLRRAKETIGDIDLVVAADEGKGGAIGHAVTAHPLCAEVLGAGPTKTSFRLANGTQVDVRVIPPESWGAAIQYFTGSKEHNLRVREIAAKMGLKLNEWGLYKGEKAIAGQTEESIYEALGLACLPPEMREDRGEIDLAQKMFKEKSPAWTTLELSDIRGDLHMHTVASDGNRTIEEMVAEAKRRGYQYIAITDHSKSQFQANGLKVDRLLAHIDAIHAVARQVKGILVLAGSEVDILADGSMDYEDDVLAKLDWVVASPHAALTQDSDAATQRLIRAAANPYVHVIGHPTGRLVPGRRGLEPDMQKAIFAAARSGVAVELNANYHRLDLRDIHLKMAVDADVPICINTDSHDLDQMDLMLYGILTARRGWVRKQNVLNARPVEAFKKWLKERRDAK